jgi:hypothetical protein
VRVPVSQCLLRAGVAAGPVGALLASAGAGARMSTGFLVLVLLLSAVAARAPESLAVLAPMVLVLGWWLVRVQEQTHPMVLVAAGCLLFGHVCALVAGLGPAAYDVEGVTLLLWSGRAVVLFPLAVLAWLVARAAEQEPVAGVWWVAAFATIGVVVVASREMRSEAE